MLTSTRRLLILLLTGLFVQQGQAASSSDIVEGFSEFLIDRANTNLVYAFERRLKDDKTFQCYFPNTYGKIEKVRLENMFSSRDYWDNSLAVDLEVLIYRSIFVEAQQGLKILDRNKLIETVQLLRYEYQGPEEKYNGKLFPVNQIDITWPQPLKDQVNGFTSSLANALNKIESQQIFKDVCQLSQHNKDELKKLLRPYIEAGEELTQWANHVDKFGKNLRLSESKKQKQDLYCRLNGIADADCTLEEFDEAELSERILDKNSPEKFRKAARIAQRIQETFEALEALDTLRKQQLDTIDLVVLSLPLLENPSFPAMEIKSVQTLLRQAKELSKDKSKEAIVGALATIKQKTLAEDADVARIANHLRGIIDERQSYTDRALVVLELLETSEQFDSARIDRLRRSVMFFVSIADAEDKDTVKNILEVYTLPAVSFAEKRKQGDGFFISSYLGFGAADTEVHDSQEDETDNGLFVPVGIEYNHGFARGDSLSIMLSPIDMAYPINLKLSGIEDDVEFDEIMAPSLTLAYGFRKYPLNIGIGYQRGRKLADVGKSEERILLFVTFDMPLFRIY